MLILHVHVEFLPFLYLNIVFFWPLPPPSPLPRPFSTLPFSFLLSSLFSLPVPLCCRPPSIILYIAIHSIAFPLHLSVISGAMSASCFAFMLLSVQVYTQEQKCSVVCVYLCIVHCALCSPLSGRCTTTAIKGLSKNNRNSG
mmetsp:Transcript_47158/g.121869  ORF Transcript_47158/g.121869 Transcript_47158/m.121869 type:complete len:142 (-) Transcript_47158:58-483(-)